MTVARLTRAPVVVAAMLAVASCVTQSPPAAQLLDTYWRVASVEGTAVTIRPGTREPHLVLRREGSRLAGFAGCNSLSGSFREDRDTLRIDDRLAMTRMACVGEGDALEAAFTKALVSTASYRISGNRLELLDTAGAIRITFENRGPLKR